MTELHPQRRPSGLSFLGHYLHSCMKALHQLISFPIKPSIHQLILPTLRFLFRIRFRTPMRRHSPVISAAIAVHTLRSNCADRDQCFSVDPSNDHTTSTFLVIFTTSVPETFDGFPLFGIAAFINQSQWSSSLLCSRKMWFTQDPIKTMGLERFCSTFDTDPLNRAKFFWYLPPTVKSPLIHLLIT